MDDRRADEAKAATAKILGDAVTQVGARWQRFAEWARADHRSAAHKTPEVTVERAKLLLHPKEQAGVGDRGFDLQTVPYDPGILEELPPARGSKARDLVGIEVRKGPAVVGALAQDRRPGQARLSALQCEHLKQQAIIVHRPAPFLVVVARVFGIEAIGPGTAFL